MLFNSGIFLQFFAAFLLLYWLVRGSLTRRNTLILAASCLFYGWWAPGSEKGDPESANAIVDTLWHCRFLALLLATSTLDFYLARIIDHTEGQRRRKQLLTLSVIANLGVLGYFKYADFFVESFTTALDTLGLHFPKHTLSLILPIGISFYTFQSMSYTIDVYRRELPATRSLKNFLAYVSFFPQLVAGPIERAKHLLPQFEHPRLITLTMIEEGLWLIVWGMFKKAVLADNFAPLAEIVFSSHSYNATTVVLGTLAFGLQIYCDFSGYSDMARGLARTLGFDLMWNFALPYSATSLREFWQRWHISLSTWLRDYLYIPLGGNRKGSTRTGVNLILTMLLGGLWHGAAWNFVLWGLWHGTGLAVTRMPIASGALNWIPGKLRRMTSWGLTMCFVFYGWMLFRCTSLSQLLDMTSALAKLTNPPWAPSFLINLIAFILPLATLEFWQWKTNNQLASLALPRWARALLQGALITAIIVFWDAKGASFIYFQF